MRFLVLTVVCLLWALPQASEASSSSSLTQRDWMINLVDGLGLSFGLPEKAEDSDYLRILSGHRQLRIEAEDHHKQSDMVSINAFQSFGPFSGKGWLNGISMPTKAHLLFNLPLSGRYQVRASVRNSGQVLQIGNNSLRIDTPGTNFHSVELGEVDLTAGPQEITIDLPPNTSIDYLEFSAPPLPAIAPKNGWNLDAPLTLGDLASVSVHLLGLEQLLPLAGKRLTIEAESFVEPTSPLLTDVRHLGQPSGGQWLRTGIPPQQLALSFTPPATEVFDLILRGASQNPVNAVLDDTYPLQATFHTYLSEAYLITREFSPDKHTLALTLESRAGIDALFLEQRRNDRSDYLRLAGLADRDLAQAEDLNRMLSLLALLQPQR